MKVRTLKTSYSARANWRKRQTEFTPKIQLSGNWLEAAGFQIGQQISVELSPGGQIIISRL